MYHNKELPFASRFTGFCWQNLDFFHSVLLFLKVTFRFCFLCFNLPHRTYNTVYFAMNISQLILRIVLLVTPASVHDRCVKKYKYMVYSKIVIVHNEGQNIIKTWAFFFPGFPWRPIHHSVSLTTWNYGTLSTAVMATGSLGTSLRNRCLMCGRKTCAVSVFERFCWRFLVFYLWFLPVVSQPYPLFLHLIKKTHSWDDDNTKFVVIPFNFINPFICEYVPLFTQMFRTLGYQIHIFTYFLCIEKILV